MVRGELMIATAQDMDRYCFDKARLTDPDWLVLLEIAGIYRHYDQSNKAVVYLRQAAAECPDNAHVWYLQAVCEDEMGLTDAARRSVRRCLDLKPQHVDAGALEAALAERGFSLIRRLRSWWRRS
jgi:tetratricopeptide (TPR) repeat protein